MLRTYAYYNDALAEKHPPNGHKLHLFLVIVSNDSNVDGRVGILVEPAKIKKKKR